MFSFTSTKVPSCFQIYVPCFHSFRYKYLKEEKTITQSHFVMSIENKMWSDWVFCLCSLTALYWRSLLQIKILPLQMQSKLQKKLIPQVCHFMPDRISSLDTVSFDQSLSLPFCLSQDSFWKYSSYFILVSGERTFGVLTKLDLMDKGTNAVDV